MAENNGGGSVWIRTGQILTAFFSPIPLLGWLSGAVIAVFLEHIIGNSLAVFLGLPKIPVLFGFVIALKEPMLFPAAVAYVFLIYVIPICIIGRLSSRVTNLAAETLLKLPLFFSVMVHVGIFYGVLHFWSDISPYRVLTLKLTLIAVMMTLSLNVINGYMGEIGRAHV